MCALSQLPALLKAAAEQPYLLVVTIFFSLVFPIKRTVLSGSENANIKFLLCSAASERK